MGSSHHRERGPFLFLFPPNRAKESGEGTGRRLLLARPPLNSRIHLQLEIKSLPLFLWTQQTVHMTLQWGTTRLHISIRRCRVHVNTALALQKRRAPSCPGRSPTNNKLWAEASRTRAGRETSAKSSLMKFQHKLHRGAEKRTVPGLQSQSDPGTRAAAHLDS